MHKSNRRTETINTTKTLKQKTKSIVIATAIGVATIFAGIGGSAASAVTTEVDDYTTICKSVPNPITGAFHYIMIDKDLVTTHACRDFRYDWYLNVDYSGTDAYTWVGQCYYSFNTQIIKDICEKGGLSVLDKFTWDNPGACARYKSETPDLRYVEACRIQTSDIYY